MEPKKLDAVVSRGFISAMAAANKIKDAERVANAFKMRKAGMSYATISSALGIDEVAAQSMIEGSIRKLARDSVETFVDIELARLDDLFEKPYENALKGDLDSVKVCLSLMERRSKFLGLDAPTKRDVKIQISKMEVSEVRDLLMKGLHGEEAEVVDAEIISEDQIEDQSLPSEDDTSAPS